MPSCMKVKTLVCHARRNKRIFEILLPKFKYKISQKVIQLQFVRWLPDISTTLLGKIKPGLKNLSAS